MADVEIVSPAVGVEHRSDQTAATRAPRTAREIYRNISWGMVVTDAISIILALGLAYVVRNSLSSISRAWLVSISAIPLAWILIFYAHGLYSPRLLSSVEEFRRVVGASTLGMVVIVMLSYWSQSSFSRIWVAVAWGLALTFELVSRVMWRLLTIHLKETGALRIRTIVIGTNGEAEGLRQRLDQKGSGFHPLGFFPAGEVYVQSDADMNLLGRHGELSDVIRRTEAECMFIASTEVTPQIMVDLVKIARREGVDVRVSATLPEMISSRVSVQSISGIMSMTLKPVQLTGTQAVVKRAFDLILASIGLILFFPVVCIAAVAIRLESKGPVIFRQARITKGGRVFEMFKLRTMSLPSTGERLDTSAPFFKLDRDPRVTRVGRFLRGTSLDEIPQLFNVIRGDMSLVGPRPLPVDQVEANLDLLSARHEVHAGVTGWWQISGRSLVRPEDAVNMDLFYIENWSLALDLYVLFRTLIVVLTRSGAR